MMHIVMVCLLVFRRWSKQEDRTNKRAYQQYVEALKPKRYPDFWPKAEENWDAWNKVEGFGETGRKANSADS